MIKWNNLIPTYINGNMDNDVWHTDWLIDSCLKQIYDDNAEKGFKKWFPVVSRDLYLFWFILFLRLTVTKNIAKKHWHDAILC